jgi:hypothetical protein
MAICDDCLGLLEHDQWHAETSNREIGPLALSCKHCSLCRFLCEFFEILIDSIRNGTVWPSAEQIASCRIGDKRALHPRTGEKLEVFVEFKVIGNKNSLLRVLGRMIPKGRSHYYPAASESVCLPLGKSSTYNKSDTTLGVCINTSGMLNVLDLPLYEMLKETNGIVGR